MNRKALIVLTLTLLPGISLMAQQGPDGDPAPPATSCWCDDFR